MPLYQYHQIYFYKPEANPSSCGRFDFEFVFDSEAREPFFPDIYSRADVYGDRMYFEGTIADLGPIVWDAPHSVLVKAVWEDGAILYSEPMTLRVENPCDKTVINP